MKIKDRILLGTLAGLVCGTPGRIINAVEYHFGITDVKYGQMAANLFLPKKIINTKEAQLTGCLTNQFGISLMGITVTYLLSATGRDHAVLKGMGVGSLAWTTVYGLTSRIGLTVKSKKSHAPILSFVDHAIFGVMCGLFVAKFGHDSLFPDSKVTNPNEKFPLIYTNKKK